MAASVAAVAEVPRYYVGSWILEALPTFFIVEARPLALRESV